MQVSVTFRHMDSSETLRRYAVEKSERICRFLSAPIEVHWVLSVEKIRQIADATVTADGVAIKAQGDTQDMYSSIDMVIDKLFKQVRRHKERVKDHKSHNVQGASIRFSETPEQAAPAASDRIVRRENVFVKPMSVEEAAMQMDVVDNDFMVFRDSSTSGINVIYRTGDGGYGLIETRSG